MWTLLYWPGPSRDGTKLDRIAGGRKCAHRDKRRLNQPAKQAPMKMPLKFGIPLLILLWLASGFTEYGQGKTLLMSLAMGVALWTAFSLPRPRSRHPEELEQDGEMEPPPTPPGGGAPRRGGEPPPSNGSGRPLNPAQDQGKKE